MSQRKWENKVKTTLEKRTIKPSDTGWNALADRLDAADKKKSKIPYWWVGVAATMVGILFAITIFFSDNTTDIQKPVMVDTQQKVYDQIVPIEKLPQQEKLAETHKDIKTPKSLEKEALTNELVKEHKDVTSITKHNLLTADNQKEKVAEPLEIRSQNKTIEGKKILEVVAQINNLKSKGQTVTDADIDALLHQAQKEMAYQTILKDGTRIVDANALLLDVETDLQQSFRNKIFEALKNSYETVKTAVAERNN